MEFLVKNIRSAGSACRVGGFLLAGGASTGGRRNFRIRGGPEFLPRRGMGICNPENPGIYYPCPKQSTL